MILFFITLIFSFNSQAQVSCPTRPIRIDKPEGHIMSPGQNSRSTTRGSLHGSITTDQGQIGNCYAHSASLIYRSLGVNNPRFSPDAISTCYSNSNTNTIVGGFAHQTLECIISSRESYCTIDESSSENARQINRSEIAAQDEALSLIRELSDENQQTLVNSIHQIIGQLGGSSRTFANYNNYLQCLNNEPEVRYPRHRDCKNDQLLARLVHLKNYFKDFNNLPNEERELTNFKYRAKVFHEMLSSTTLPNPCAPEGTRDLIQKLGELSESPTQQHLLQFKEQLNNLGEPNAILNYRLLLAILVDRQVSSSSEKINWDEIIQEDTTDKLVAGIFKSGASRDNIISDVKNFHREYRPDCELFNKGRALALFPICSLTPDLNAKLESILYPIISLGNTSESISQKLNFLMSNYDKTHREVFRNLNRCPSPQRKRARLPEGASVSRIRSEDDIPCDENLFSQFENQIDDFYSRGTNPKNIEFLSNIVPNVIKRYNDHHENKPSAVSVREALETLNGNFMQGLSSCLPSTSGELQALISNESERNRCKSVYKERFKSFRESILPTVRWTAYGEMPPVNAKLDDVVCGIISGDQNPNRLEFLQPIFRARNNRTLSKRMKIIQNSLTEISNNRAVGISLCWNIISRPRSSRTIYPATGLSDECGAHAITAIGYKCAGDELMVLLQNSHGTSFCRQYGGKVLGIPCEAETGKFWMKASDLSRSLLGVTTVPHN